MATENVLSQRLENIKKIENSHFDVIIIGGGATGLGCAVDAVSRGYKTLLVEAADYAKATSSRSTKLLHGGVRYLAQGDIGLVRSALKERYKAIQNAPHLAKELLFLIPCYNLFAVPYYYMGLKAYDILCGSLKLTSSCSVSKKNLLKRLPNLDDTSLRGGIQYSDGSFDDARMAITLMKTFAEKGGVAVNRLEVTGLIKKDIEHNGSKKVAGVHLHDHIGGITLSAHGDCIINATGIFSDNIRKMDDTDAKPVIKWAQGIHLVVDKKHFPGEDAMLIPKTSDGRVLFLVPWHDKVLVGTTDTEVDKPEYEPSALKEEINFVINMANTYLKEKITPQDVLTVYAGIRPLVMDGHANSAKVARDDKKFISDSGMVTIAGGKWTTYRKMGETTIDFAIKNGALAKKEDSKTLNMPLFGYLSAEEAARIPESERVYGSEYQKISSMPTYANKLSSRLPITEAHVEYAVLQEQALTVDDVLSRRTRCLLLDAREAANIAPKVASIIARLIGKSEDWEEAQVKAFNDIAKHYIIETYL